VSFLATPSQTVGPFFRPGLEWGDGPYVVPPGWPGGLWIRGRVLDGEGHTVPDALVETWQADPWGCFALGHEPRAGVQGFRGFGRSSTDEEGVYGVFTVKPGRHGDGRQAPHVNVSVLARGLLHRAVTRIYFVDEARANEDDPVLASLPDPSRRSTLVAAIDGDGYRFDIRLQGEHETIFFAF
jgi:protocatechuate 3,4-dioxygenase alpha subunit